MKIFSTVHQKVSKRALKHACFWAVSGFSLLFYMGIFLSKTELEKWGLIGFMIGISLISAGMIPYRRLKSLELKPHVLMLKEKGLEFKHARKGTVFFRDEDIKDMHFIEKKTVYGIRLSLKSGQYFFLPYFSRESYNIMHMDESDDFPIL